MKRGPIGPLFISSSPHHQWPAFTPPRWPEIRPALTKGRVALTGDAAWCATPVSGIGTTLAVVGAYILAGELAKTDDHEAAFQEYDRLMRPFVEEGQGKGKGPSWTHPQSRFGITLQRATLNLLSKPILRNAFMALGMRDPGDVELPDYRFHGATVSSQKTDKAAG